MNKQIEAYLKSQANNWSPATIKSERSRLAQIAPYLDGNPEALWKALEQQKPYTRQTTWIRASAFWAFVTGKQETPYHVWKNQNKNLFKNAYQPKRVETTWEEAKAKVERITDSSVRSRALAILHSGQRFSESCQPKGETIIGKGNRIRPDFRADESVEYVSYQVFYRSLQQVVGLTPHQLRKLAITRLASRGASAADLCRFAGWSSIETAFVYLQPQRDEKLKEMMR